MPNVSVRNSRTAATTAALSPPAPTNPPMYPSSITPSPPGVIGSAEINRPNEKTANASAVLTSCSDTPRWRSDSSRMRKSASWLSSVVQVKRIHRRDTRSIVSVRNFEPRVRRDR